MLAGKADLYDTWGKVMNCGGGGQCGTCAVAILEDAAGVCSPRTGAEQGKLKGKPADWRLACQTNVGDGTNGGAVRVRIRPQKK